MKASNKQIAGGAAAIVIGMLGLSLAAEPLYSTFCQVTGFGGTTRIATAPPTEVSEQMIEVRFDANVADTPLAFRPLQTEQRVQIGAHGLAFYEVTNPTDDPIRVIATYNVTPHFSGLYFNKLECFCFEERVIQPHETKKLPVVYFVGPEILEDRVAKGLETITLSYTFFDSSDYAKQKQGAANSAKPG